MTDQLSRRNFVAGLIASPALIRADLLMPIRSIAPMKTADFEIMREIVVGYPRKIAGSWRYVGSFSMVIDRHASTVSFPDEKEEYTCGAVCLPTRDEIDQHSRRILRPRSMILRPPASKPKLIHAAPGDLLKALAA